MLTDRTDFACTNNSGVISCAAVSQITKEIYSNLQARLQNLVAAMARTRTDVPPHAQDAPVFGTITPSTTIAAQYVLKVLSLSASLPFVLDPIIAPTTPAVDAIRLLSQRADEVDAYIARTVAANPGAINVTVDTPVKKSSQVGPIVLRSVLALGGGLALMALMAAVARKTSRKSAGVEDGRHFLPPDQDDDDDVDGDEAADEAEPETEAEEPEKSED